MSAFNPLAFLLAQERNFPNVKQTRWCEKAVKNHFTDKTKLVAQPVGFMSATYSPKGIVFPSKPLIGIDLMRFAFQPDLEVLLTSVYPAGHPSASQGSAHVGVLAVDGEIAPGPDSPRKGSLLDVHEPAGSHHGLGVGNAGEATRGG